LNGQHTKISTIDYFGRGEGPRRIIIATIQHLWKRILFRCDTRFGCGRKRGCLQTGWQIVGRRPTTVQFNEGRCCFLESQPFGKAECIYETAPGPV